MTKNHRLDLLQPYPFEKMRSLFAACEANQAKDFINLSIGEPKHSPPEFIVSALADPKTLAQCLNQYPATQGSDALREAISQWLDGRFDVKVSADTQILPVNGTREALFAFAQAMLGDAADGLVGMPNPFYQIYEGAALLAGATPYFFNHEPAFQYGIDFDSVPASVWQGMDMMYICSPANPTGNLLDQAALQDLIRKAHDYDFIIAADECYAEIYFSDAEKPTSLLAASAAMGATDFSRCAVFHSLSKRSNLPGLRSGFVAGDATLMQRFLKYRTYHGCALGAHHQLASTLAWQDESHVSASRQLYRDKFTSISSVLAPHFALHQPAGGFYHWLKTPVSDTLFAQQLLNEENIKVVPGSYLARGTGQANGGLVDASGDYNPGANHVRVAWVAQPAQCLEAATRLASFASRHA